MARSGSLAAIAAAVLLFAFYIPAQAAVPQLRQPAWAELTAEQKQILAPLAQDWDKLEGYRRKKWLGIAQRYPSMSPDEQARLQRRMKDWAALTPEQRRKVREQYKVLQKAPPEHREAVKQKWQEYKELPEDEKKRLAETAARKPTPKAGSRPASGLPVAKPPAPPAIQPAHAGAAPEPAPADSAPAQAVAPASTASEAQPAPARQ
jgi:hypothetical protein